MFGLFGAKKREKDLRDTLSLHKFEMEFPKVLETFKIAPNRRANKTERYAEIESAARFILERVIKDAARQGKMKAQDDLAAAAAFSAMLCDYLGRHGGLDDADVRELQGFVPGFVFPRVAAQLMQSSGDFRTIVSKGLFKYDSLNKKKANPTLDRLEDNLTQFICQRDPQYLTLLGEGIAGLK
jgi:hypothetical protein